MSNSNDPQDDNGGRREPATEVFLAKQRPPIAAPIDLGNRSKGYRHQDEDV
jgi:hypothetical protein